MLSLLLLLRTLQALFLPWGELVFAEDARPDAPAEIAEDDGGENADDDHDGAHGEGEPAMQDVEERSSVQAAEDGDAETEQQPDGDAEAAAERAAISAALCLRR